MKKGLLLLVAGMCLATACTPAGDNAVTAEDLYQNYCHVVGMGFKELFPQDYTGYCSLFNKQALASFDASTDGFYSPDKGAVLSVEDTEILTGAYSENPEEVRDRAQKVYRALAVRYPDEAGNAWRTVIRDFPDGLDMSERVMLQFRLKTTQAPGRNNMLRVTLSDGQTDYQMWARKQSRKRELMVFDCSACPFRQNIKKIEIALMSQSEDTWHDACLFIDNVAIGKPMDFTFNLPHSADCFSAQGGTVSQGDGTLNFRFNSPSCLEVCTKGSDLWWHNAPLEVRNTFMVVMENRSSCRQLRLSFLTDDDTDYSPKKSKVFDIAPNSPSQAHYFNLSDVPDAWGELAGFRLEPLDGEGELVIDRITLELEEPIVEYAGQVESCTADKDFVRISGSVRPEVVAKYKTLAIYEEPYYLSEPDGHYDRMFAVKNPNRRGEPNIRYGKGDISRWTLLYEVPLTEHFDIRDLPNSRLGGKMTHLSTRFSVVARNSDSDYLRVDKPLFISNWRDFEVNPYAFTLPDHVYNVTDFGARGDGFTDDTRAIQAALDAAGRTGGTVLVPGSTDRYGRRYVITQLNLHSNTELHLEPGSVLWQTQELRDYQYAPYFAHNIVIPGMKWTHSLDFNYPLIRASEATQVRVTGGGQIRMADQWDDYEAKIHLAPLAFYGCTGTEVSDIEIIRSPNYHHYYSYTNHSFVGNVHVHQLMCHNGDGLTLSDGVHHLRVVRAVNNTDDDGVVFGVSSRANARHELWKPFRADEEQSLRHIEIMHSYINSGSHAKAIALIPWGKSNPDQSRVEIDSVLITDCVLRGGLSIGDWPDNPYDGRPFDNDESDDYSPVKDVRIVNNEYVTPIRIRQVQPTGFVTDCGLHSASQFKNGGFSDGSAYWTMTGDASVRRAEGHVGLGGMLSQGLYVTEGHHLLCADVLGTASFVVTTPDGQVIAEKAVTADHWTNLKMDLDIPQTGEYRIGFRGGSSDSGNSASGSVAGAHLRRCEFK